MGTETEKPVGPELEELRGRFEQWRQNRKRGSRVPKDLWDAAVGLTKDYTLSQLSRVLGLHYGQLRKRTQSKATLRDPDGERTAPPVFVELGTSQPPRTLSADCVVEFENPRGVKVRMHFRKPRDLDLAAVSKAFWRNGE
jgi:hypothetical protein